MGRVIRLPPPVSAHVWHGMARARHRQALERKLMGDEDGYLAMLEDVRELDQKATDARVREERLYTQRRKFAAALDGILDLAEKHRESK